MKQALLERKGKAQGNGALPVVRTTVVFDYPQEGEIIESPEYSLRVGTPNGAESVEISINQGEWRPCRSAVGYWWFDWSGFEPGEYQVMARVRTDGRTETSKPRTFYVKKNKL